MAGLAEIASVMIVGAERRIEVAAGNVSNIETPGYRTRRVFADLLDPSTQLPITREAIAGFDRQTSMIQTGNPIDFASSAGTLMALRGEAGVTYTRSVQLQRSDDGRLIDPAGRTLLSVDGAEMIVSSSDLTVLSDGVVLVDGRPQAKIGLFEARNDGGLGGMEAQPTSGGSLNQGMVIASDVELSDEMIELNHASRMAETGAKLFQLYDDLIAKTASQVGTTGR